MLVSGLKRMRVSDFHFDLPDELIARYPLAERTASRLLCLDGPTGAIAHRQFAEIRQLLKPGDLLVMNDTRVIPARLFGHKETGGRIEILVERIIDEHTLLAHIRASKPPKPGQHLNLDGGDRLLMLEREDSLFRLGTQGEGSVLALLERHGHMPLPPYMAREDEASDRERYQTVYARHAGAVAAPTAGLHFDSTLLDHLRADGIETAFVTLHVGAGTFQPVRVEQVEAHQMHAEYLVVPPQTVAAVDATRARGGRVIAVGTTSVRSLETASASGRLESYAGDTRIFIYPGYRFKTVDALITNFHLPESTLIMLVSAFAGQAQVMAAYREAIEQRYRFYSYGDAMFLTRREPD